MKRGLHKQIKFGYESAPYPWQTISDLAVYVEAQGFDSFWMPDHTVGFGIRRWDSLEAWTVLSGIAMQTKRIALGTCVSDTHRHHPAVLAQMAATCDIISIKPCCPQIRLERDRLRSLKKQEGLRFLF